MNLLRQFCSEVEGIKHDHQIYMTFETYHELYLIHLCIKSCYVLS